MKKMLVILSKVISNWFILFSQNTSLHGFKYIGDRSISFCERIYFFFSFTLVLTCVGILTWDIYSHWEETPILIGLRPNPILIPKFPFPAVTICNVNQAQASKVKNYSRNSVEHSMLQTLCLRSTEIMNPSKMADIKNRTLFQRFIQNIAQPCEKLLISCKYGTDEKVCADIFTPILTDEGQCCVFNSLHPSFFYKRLNQFEGFIQLDGAAGVDWDPENEYQKNLPKVFYPRPGYGTGISMGLSLVINAEVDDYFCTSRNGPGFKLLLHNPVENPSLRENGLLVEPGAEMTFRIRADRLEASQDIRDLSIKKRKCVFQSERNLKYFQKYTKRNCEIECLMDKSSKNCECISYFHPESWTYKPACTLKDFTCQKKWEKICKDSCVEGCFDLSFTPTKFVIPLTSGGYMIQNQMLEKFNTSYLKNNIAVVHFYYKFSNFDAFIRTGYVGTTEFLSKTGGLIGLLGLSFIAVAEFFYFVILRPSRTFGRWLLDLLTKSRNKDSVLTKRKSIFQKSQRN